MPKRRTSPPAESFLYGRQAVREALRAGRRKISQLQLASGIKPTPIIQEIQQLARQRHLPIHFVDRRLLDEALGHSHHQGVLLETGPYPYASLDDILARADAQQQPPFILLLDRVQDPQNLGSLLRTAEACAVHGIIIPKHRAASVTPAVGNASAGAVEHLLISRLWALSSAPKASGSAVWYANTAIGLLPCPCKAGSTRSTLRWPVRSSSFGRPRPGYPLARLNLHSSHATLAPPRRSPGLCLYGA